MANQAAGENDPRILVQIRAFLNALNQSDAKPMETMEPSEARKVLEDAQKSVEVDTSDIIETQKGISHDGQTININIIRPDSVSIDQILPAFIFIHGGGWVLGDYL